MDPVEKRLTDAYERAADELRAIPKGDPRHIRAAAKVIGALRALRKYQAKRN